MNQGSRQTSTHIRPILQFSANQSILSKSQRHPILRRKVAKPTQRLPCGAMAGAMLATYPEVFAGGAMIAGKPFRIQVVLAEHYSAAAVVKMIPERRG